tara:strand:- start:153 stop:353 length:201 start_codon:yes stop_codon:yes gene_type:complete
MAKYLCKNCGMKTKNLKCNGCGKTLRHSHIKRSDGTKIYIIECKDGCQKLKSPICCSQDMVQEEMN